MESGLLEQLELPDVGESGQRVPGAFVGTGGNAPASVLEFVEEALPLDEDTVPVGFVPRRPLELAGAVGRGVRYPVVEELL